MRGSVAVHALRRRLEQRHPDPADVLGARAQRRHLDRAHGEAVVEIEPEMPGVRVGEQIAIRRRDDPHVDVTRLARADGPELARLERAQEQRLERGRRLPNLVEEERPTVGQLEEAAPCLLRAREGALHVAEELARHELGRQRREVLSDEPRATSPAALVDLGGDELLAGARSPRGEGRSRRCRRRP